MARILIVEDEQRIASFVGKGLRAEGHQATIAGDGPTGLDHALSGEFDLMVLDIGLPALDGFEVLDQLRSQGSRMPVIVLTARDSVADTVSALEGGADDYMAKPFRFAELLARVRLRLRQANEKPNAREDLLEAGSLRLDLRAMVELVGFRVRGGNSPIPPDGLVLSGHGTGSAALVDLWERQQRQPVKGKNDRVRGTRQQRKAQPGARRKHRPP